MIFFCLAFILKVLFPFPCGFTTKTVPTIRLLEKKKKKICTCMMMLRQLPVQTGRRTASSSQAPSNGSWRNNVCLSLCQTTGNTFLKSRNKTFEFKWLKTRYQCVILILWAIFLSYDLSHYVFHFKPLVSLNRLEILVCTFYSLNLLQPLMLKSVFPSPVIHLFRKIKERLAVFQFQLLCLS